jgi:hypothetical protein
VAGDFNTIGYQWGPVAVRFKNQQMKLLTR